MGLHLNLYHEIIQAKKVKARDPLKLSLIALCFIGACFAGYYFVQLNKMRVINGEHARQKAKADELAPKAAAAVKREQELVANNKLSESLVKKIEERFYWAPLLDQVTRLVPRTMQITKFTGDIAGENKRCVLAIDGIASGADPRKSAEELRTALAQTFSAQSQYKDVSSIFRTLEEGAESVTFDGKQWPTATFSITVQFTTGEGASSTPPPVRRKR